MAAIVNQHHQPLTDELVDIAVDNGNDENDEKESLIPNRTNSEQQQKFKGRRATKRTTSTVGGSPRSETSRPSAKPSSSNGGTTPSSSSRPMRTTKRIATSRRTQRNYAHLMKHISLVLLVTQMVGLVLLMRFTRTKGAKHSADGSIELYLASTAVFLMEVTKLLICSIVVFVQAGSTLGGLIDAYYVNIWQSPLEVLKLCVPSLLYTIQNNLLYFALSNLDAATYQVCYQLKILTTALFSVILLQRKFSLMKWISLVILTVGVAIVQHSSSSDGAEASAVEKSSSNTKRFMGLVAVLCAACTSGFAGVYFEKILKGSKTSLWLRNIQMGLPSVIIAFVGVFAKDGEIISRKGFFTGYNNMVWTVVFVQAAGGLIVAVVVKYADNVLKVFATSFSIILSSLVSAILFDFRPDMSFVIGAIFVMISTVLYAEPFNKKSSSTTTTTSSKLSGPRKDQSTVLPLHNPKT